MKMKMRRVLSMIMMFMMVINMIPTNVFAETESSNVITVGAPVARMNAAEQSLKPYITGASDKLDDDKVFPNPSFVMNVSYNIPYYAFSNQTNTEVYKVWSFTAQEMGFTNFDLTKMVTSGKIIDPNTKVEQGTFTAESGKITLTFNDDFLATAAKPGGGAVGNLVLAGKWSFDSNSESDVVKKEIGDDTLIVYPYGLGDIKVAKTVSTNYDRTSAEITYKMNVSTTQGTHGSYTAPNGKTYGIKLVDTLPSNTTLVNMWMAPEDAGLDHYVDIANKTVYIQNLNHGKDCDVYVTVKVTNKVTGGKENKANVYTKDGLDANKTYESKATAQLMYPSIKKYVEKYDNATGKITWKIMVNSGSTKYDLAGLTLKDRINDKTYLDFHNAHITYSNSLTGAATTEGYKINTDGSITFQKINNAENKKTYYIYLTTDATLIPNNSNTLYSDTNKAWLYDGDDQLMESKASNTVSASSYPWVEKSKNWDSKNRIITYTIKVNPHGKGNIYGMTITDDWQNTIAQKGLEFVSGSGTYTGNGKTGAALAGTTLAELIANANAVIRQGDNKTTGRNMNTYTFTYQVKVPLTTTSVPKNTASLYLQDGKIGSDYENGPGVGTDFISKSKGFDATNGHFKWTITINPNQYEMDASWEVKDTLSAGELLTNRTITIKETPRTGSAKTTNYTAAQLGITNMATLVSYINNNLVNPGVTSKWEVTYYTSLPEGAEYLDSVSNTASLKGDSSTKSQQTNFDGGLTKAYSTAKKVDGGYELTWTLTMKVPKYELGGYGKIVDTLSGNHYIPADKVSGMTFSELDALGVNYTVTANTTNGNKVTKFTITMDKLPVDPDGTVTLTYKTFCPSDLYYGKMGNSATSTFGGDNGKLSWNANAETEVLPQVEIFKGAANLNGDGKFEAEQIRYDIHFTVEPGMGAHNMIVTDTLPAGIELVSVSTYKNGVAQGGYSAGSLPSYMTYNNKTLTVNCGKASDYKVGDVLKMIVTVKATAEFFDGAIEKNLKNTAKLTLNGKTTESTDEHIVVNPIQYVDPVSKSHTPPVAGSNEVSYTVDLNPAALKVQEGKESTLTVVDTLIWNYRETALKDYPHAVQIIDDSIYLTRADGSRLDPSLYKCTPNNNAGNGKVTLTLTIPDSMHLKLHYTYKIEAGYIGNASEAKRLLKFTNTVNLSGYSFSDSSSDNVQYTYVDYSAASVTTQGVKFVKVNAKNETIKVEGAQFELAKYNGTKWVPVANGNSGVDGVINFVFNNGEAYEKKVAYRLTETKAPDGYKDCGAIYFSIDGAPTVKPSNWSGSVKSTGASINVPNEPTTVDLTVNKTWFASQGKTLPASVTFVVRRADAKDIVVATDTATAPNWSVTFKDLTEYANGELIQYYIEELAIDGWESNVGTAVKGTDGNLTVAVTNTELTDITIQKIWNDFFNQDGLRPSEITLELHRNGTKIKEAKLSGTASSHIWTYTFKDLPKFDSQGNAYNYTAVETTVPTGYTKVESGLVVTNMHTPAEITVSGEKTWNDADNQDGKRPASITINLLANGTKVNSATVTADKDGKWTYRFTGLPKYEAGKEIAYTITEDSVAGYTTKIDGYNVKNSYTPEKTEATVKKVWDDGENRDGIRPESLKVTLSDGTEVTLNAANNWTATVKDLPKYADGKEITYTWTEENLPEGYKLTSTKTEGTITTLTNKHAPEKITFHGEKIWDDANNQDGIRPESITVYLYANGAPTGQQCIAEESNDWSWSFNPVYKYTWYGEEIEYTIVEETVEGYKPVVTREGNSFELTNKHEPAKITVSGEKTWDDANNQDGIRPESITINLLANGTKVDSATVTAGEDGKWTYSFTDLPKFEAGKAIVYSIEEIKVDGYETKIDGFDVNNKHVPELTEATVKKVWDDANNQDGVRPASLTVTLSDGTEVTLNEANNWTATVKDLPKYAAGVEINYTWTEGDMPEGYALTNTSKNGTITTLTNSRAAELTQATVKKVWDDANDQDGIRPDSLTVTLSDGTEVTLNETNNWSATVTELPKYANGVEIEYTWTESGLPEGYELTSNTKDGTITTLTNKHVPELTEINGVKNWDDNDNQDGIRPGSVTIKLFADNVDTGKSTTASAPDWTWSFTGLDKYRDHGTEIVYTVAEVPVEKYTTKIDGYTITNKYTPAVTEVSGTKTWNDANDQDGIRPESITIVLLADGTEVERKTVTANDNWTWEFTNLPKMKDGGKEIKYTIQEFTVAGYTTTINGFNVTNEHEPEEITISGEKTWNDANNQDGIRPESITINLLADGEEIQEATVKADEDGKWTYTFTGLPKYKDHGTEIKYTITEDAVEGYTAAYTDFDVENSYTPETIEVNGEKTWDDCDDQDGLRPLTITIRLYADGTEIDSVDVTEEDDWKWSFTDLPKFKDGGKEIVYTITEDEVENYETIYDGHNVSNCYTPETTEVSITKTWLDNNDQDGIRPKSITINLLADGEKSKSATVTPDEDGNWAYTFEDLPKYRDHGTEIKYTITEEKVDGYETTINGYDVTNEHKPAEITISGEKTWNDNNDQDGIRPDSITINLLADGEKKKSATVTPDEDGNWAYTFEDLPKYRDHGTEIKYAISEEKVDGYETEINGYDVTNSHKPAEITISGEKTWLDNNDQDGIRPDSITINLLADGTEIKEATVTPDEDGNWAYTFENLPKYRDQGQEIVYTITEDEVKDYETAINGYNVTNSHKPAEVEFSGKKTWTDNNDQDGIRPDSITINLLADGEVIKTVTVTENDGWAWAFTNLPKYKDQGTEIKYTITENPVDQYETVITGFDVENSYVPKTTEVKGTKTWIDNNDEAGKRPESITIRLYADGTEIDSKTVTEKDGWAYSFTELPMYRDGGVEIIYTVTEDAIFESSDVLLYTTEQNGTDFTNTIAQRYTELEGAKTWIDNNDEAGKRPESIEIKLMRDGNEVVETITVTEEDDWSWSFTNLPKYAVPCEALAGMAATKLDGHTFTYTVVETEVEDYTTKYQDSNESEYINNNDVINTIAQEYTELEGAKTWIDNNNEAGKRPESIEITLMRDGDEVVKTITVTGNTKTDADWTWSFTNLPKYAVPCDELAGMAASKLDGHTFTYTVVETAIDGYTTEYVDGVESEYINDNNVINTIAQEYTELNGAKTWIDGNNEAGKRPESIEIKLMRDGKDVIKTITVSGDATTDEEWAWSFTGLPMYAVPCDELKDLTAAELDGHTFTYTVVETKVNDYTTKYEDSNDSEYIYNNDVTNTIAQDYTELEGAKTWIDGNDEAGKRPESIEIHLMRDDEEEPIAKITVSGDPNSNEGWEWSFTDLPMYAVDPEFNKESDYRAYDDRDGHTFTYYVVEVEVDDYTTEYEDSNESKYINDNDVINTIAQEYIELNGAKTWIDGNNEAGNRPESITINLWRDTEIIKTITVSGDATTDEGWTWNFTDLPKYAVPCDELKDLAAADLDGHTFEYYITEDAIYETEDELLYTTEYEDNNDTEKFGNTDVINTIAQRYTELNGSKTWIDGGNEPGKRPESITINLWRDTEIIKTITVSGDAMTNDGWTWSFTDLPKYAVDPKYNKESEYPAYSARDGHTFEYYITEDAIYETEDELLYTTEYEDNNDTEKFGNTDVINTIAQRYTELSGTKKWVDPKGTKHDPITINLLRDGIEVDEVILENGVTEYTFEHLPVYAVPCEELADVAAELLDGHIYVYTVTEDPVEGYTTVQKGTNFINTIEQEYIPVTVNKIWNDKGAVGVVHPTITIHLLRDGQLLETIQLEDGQTSYTFKNLMKYNLYTGQYYKYTVEEEVVDGYTTFIDGVTITNTTIEPEKISISGTKTWSGDNGAEHNNAVEVKLTLKRSVPGGAMSTVTDAEVIWEGDYYFFHNLLKYDENGKEYRYFVLEEKVEGYGTFYEGYNIINRKEYDVVPITVSGTKYWVDGDNARGVRPETVTIKLLRDGVVIDTVEIGDAHNWTYTFADLPDNDGYGHYYTYTVTEKMVPSYWLRVDGYDLYNTFREEEEEGGHREEELEELLEIFDYGVPLWGGLLGTGDETPIYPFAFGGMGLVALAAYVLLNKKSKRA